jgi:molecular chaperone IbpA
MYVHKGISARNWNKSFRLSEYTEVNGADLTDGILTVNLEVVLPEEKQPRKISIRKNEELTNDRNRTKKLESA